jgi:hypothetical protein
LALRKTPFSQNFSYVCTEPALAKRSFSVVYYTNGFSKGVSRTALAMAYWHASCGRGVHQRWVEYAAVATW